MIRDYVQDKTTLLRTLYAIDAEMKASAGAWSSPLQNGIISFLKELQPTIL
jgi:hypothetical protein